MSATAQPPKLIACKPFEWTLLIRRLHLPPKHRKLKLVAYTLATYADFDDGKNVRPGLKRLSRDTGYCEKWVSESVRELRDNWLLYRHRKGSSAGKTNLVDIYQLCKPSDWASRFVLTDEIAPEPEPADDPWAPQ